MFETKSVSGLRIVLSFAGIAIILIAFIHILGGVEAELILGSVVSNTSLQDAGLDSQNRFYGAAFSLYGILFLVGARNLPRYYTILMIAFGTFFLAGVSRLLSVYFLGWPPPIICVLLAVELLFPPWLPCGYIALCPTKRTRRSTKWRHLR